MSELRKFSYEGQFITFDFGDGNKMINATEMAKIFGKRVGNFLQNKQTQDYIVLLESRYWNSSNEPERQVLRVVQGGSPELQGTWMDEKLALKFAGWLSPEFELWVYDRIYELLTTGKTQLPDYQPSGIIKGLRMIVQQLEEQEQINQEVKQELVEHRERIDEIEAKVLSIDENYYSVSGYCALHGIDCPLPKARKWGYSATKLSNQQGIAIGKAYDAKYGEINTYHKDILAQVIIP